MNCTGPRGQRRGSHLVLGEGRPPKAGHLSSGWRRSWPDTEGQDAVLYTYYYLRTVRPTEQETTAIENCLYSRIPRKGVRHVIRGRHGSIGFGQEAEGSRGKCGQEPLLWFPREETRASGFSMLRIGYFESLQWLQSMGAVASGLLPGPE